jgi:hypothetical protein
VDGQFVDDVRHRRRADRIETEMNVKDVELVMVSRDPLGIEHQWRPPTAGHFPSVGGDRIG